MNYPKAIIFDWDNTLVRSWPAIQKSLNSALSAFKLKTWTESEVKKKVRHSLRDSFPKLFGDNWKEAEYIFYKKYSEIHAELIEPIDEIENMLNQLNKYEIYLCIVSNKNGDFLRKEVSYLNWDRYFKKIVGAKDATQDKPSIEPVAIALNGQHSPNGKNIWFVGDTDIDMECAYNSNCVPVLLRKDHPNPGEFGSYYPSFHFKSGNELCNKLRKLYPLK